MKTIYLAGGCFWGTQHFFDQFEGIARTEVGFANGRTERPSYRQVCREGTGHAETVRIDYDETVLPTRELLFWYFLTIDPLSVDRQGGDAGHQYRTGIYYDDASLLPDISACIAEETAKAGAPLAVEVLPLQGFWPAEEEHQKYLEKNPGGYCHIPDHLMHIRESQTKEKESQP